ncbi:LIVCS family branched-chain amino acid:cation transporter [Aquimarina sp. EL_43]|uniref:branched-chain amino acid transport system II carrier protein n=1 Tax=unclassified Aquimarina TaxID=2627091 RepID=UPI0018CB71FF|nr:MULTISPECIES: branched-chain amino acid transport system II carrier protein [unclassified Aquimarina]MBG6133131.1 LIVCS family branched-chain amino acid:cation transporter [Aquimarina sp. EL_35]MBG6153289.1 LIVCS family branched-chain amino acid:cation transporter [Aquimarina sp. EL_32]MBG6171442.1 LIVCS family branched-chain amino acid:cation transporter [Aquimarina sp. EL_43]
MRFNKETFVAGFALFSMFFGAGNLMLPPLLGYKAGDAWFLVIMGFAISAVVIPLLGIFAHARLQGTMLDFAKKVSPTFSLVYCILVYLISITLPSPRTASVTHEMAIEPFFGTNAWLTSTIYFALVLLFVLNRSKILSLLGKFLSPIIFIVVLSIICISIFSMQTPAINPSEFGTPFIKGLLEGYQTFDAIGAVVVGGVIIVSLKIKGENNFDRNRKLIIGSGVLAGIGLFVIYAGMIYSGALFGADFDTTISRTDLLSGMSLKTLGSIGKVFLSILVGLACFTTAVGIVTGTADFIKGICNGSQKAYLITAIVACILGVLMGQFDVHYIIDVAIPALMFIYPLTIVLILLNVLPNRFTSSLVFRTVVIVTILFSIPDFLGSIGMQDHVAPILKILPLGVYSLAWLLPALVTLVVMNIFSKTE